MWLRVFNEPCGFWLFQLTFWVGCFSKWVAGGITVDWVVKNKSLTKLSGSEHVNGQGGFGIVMDWILSGCFYGLHGLGFSLKWMVIGT